MTESVIFAPMPEGRGRERVRLRVEADVVVGALLAAAALVGYGALALRLSQGRYYEYDNLAFDFDASRAFSLLTGSPPHAFGFKHPFMLLVRPLGLTLLAAGLTAKAAAGLAMAGVGAARVGLAYAFLRTATVGRAEAAALSCLFAVTSTQLVTAMVTETYGFASLSLMLVWLLAQRAVVHPGRPQGARVAAAVFAAGVTITNALQPFVAEACVALCSFGLRGAIRSLIRFGMWFAAVFAIIALALWPAQLWEAAQHPATALHTIWWMQTKGPTTGPFKVLETVFGFSFVSPVYTVVPLPETTRMIDFREWSFPGSGGAVAVCWLIMCALGTVAALRHPVYRHLATAMAIALLFNILFHLGFQYRGSVYIYMAHTHFLVFALAAGSALWIGARPHARAVYCTAVLLLTVAIAAVNLPSGMEFAARFDQPDTICPAPCADGRP